MTLNDILNLVVVCAVVLFVLGFGIYMLAGKGEAIISGYGGRAKGEPPKYNAKNLSRLIGLVLILLDLIVTATALLSSLQIAPWRRPPGGIAVVVIVVFITRLRQCEQEDTPALKPIRAESMKRAPEFPEPFSGVYSGADGLCAFICPGPKFCGQRRAFSPLRRAVSRTPDVYRVLQPQPQPLTLSSTLAVSSVLVFIQPQPQPLPLLQAQLLQQLLQPHPQQHLLHLFTKKLQQAMREPPFFISW